MLAALTYSSVAKSSSNGESAEFEPGIFAFAYAIVRGIRTYLRRADDSAIEAMIDQNGGRLTDSLERRIAQHCM